MASAKTGLAGRIEEIMQQKGMTQSQLAALLGISQPAVSGYLQGRMPPSDILFKIARIGGTTVEWLMEGGPRDAPAAQVREPTAPYGQTAVLIELWARLPEAVQQSLLVLIRHLGEKRSGQ